VKPDARIFWDTDALGRAAAQSLADRIKATVTGGGRFRLMLAGGNTPSSLYRLLPTKYRDEIRSGQVEFFWGDERYVSPTDSRSNYRMAREASSRSVASAIEECWISERSR
jgi:6-phosphogluconolactonase